LKPADYKTKKILYVDDQEDMRIVVRSVLEENGFQVECASDGQEALEKIGSHHYPLIITDNQMPRLSGVNFVQKLREQRYPAKIIALSGNIPYKNGDALRRLQVDRIIHKPCNIAELLRAVDQLLQEQCSS
jgi:CheY-like chemotaxis protein